MSSQVRPPESWSFRIKRRGFYSFIRDAAEGRMCAWRERKSTTAGSPDNARVAHSIAGCPTFRAFRNVGFHGLSLWGSSGLGAPRLASKVRTRTWGTGLHRCPTQSQRTRLNGPPASPTRSPTKIGRPSRKSSSCRNGPRSTPPGGNTSAARKKRAAEVFFNHACCD
jgi:hypothetical protein